MSTTSHLVLALALLAPGLLQTGCRTAGVKPETGPSDPDETGIDTPQDTGPWDRDGDGFLAAEDCDDDDPSVHPGAPEVEGDGVDNDCDGSIDEIAVCQDGVALYGSIQAAYDAAPSGSTLEICPGLYFENLDLSTKAMTLRSIEGADSTIISGDKANTVIMVGRNTGLFLQGLTVANGLGTNGGGLYCRNGGVHLDGMRFQNNMATNGGAVYAENCDIDISGSTFATNQADHTAKKIEEVEQGIGWGGGVALNQCSGTVRDSMFEGNIAYYGGGLLAYPGTVTLTGNIFSANEGMDGGGLHTSAGTADVTGNTFDANHCTNDGGGYFVSRGSETITGNVFTNNLSDDDAGGLRVYVSAVTVTGNEFYGNIATDDGGGAKFSHYESLITDNWFEGNVTGDAGGGLELDNDTSVNTDNTFIGNQAGRGGGLHSWRNEAAFVIEDDYFEANHATDCGGGLAYDNTYQRVTFRHLTFIANTGNDGAAFCTDFFYWDSDDDDKPDTWMYSEGRFENIIVAGNIASDDGGVAYVKVGTMEITNFVAEDNTGVSSSAFAFKDSADVTLKNGIISNGNDAPAIYTTFTGDKKGYGLVEPVYSVSYTDFWNNDGGNVASGDDPVGSDGNISANPDYVGAEDYHLQGGSACVDVGDPNLRDADNSRSDMGGYGGPEGSW